MKEQQKMGKDKISLHNIYYRKFYFYKKIKAAGPF